MKTSISILFAIALAAISIPAFAQEHQPKEDIQSFVRHVHMQGVPYHRAILFDRDVAVPALLAMLKDRREELSWPNVVITLGMLGDERTIKPLIAFLEENTGEQLSGAHYVAKSNVMLALGYSIHKREDKRALQYLIDSAQPAMWAKRKLGWISPYHSSAAERDRQLSTMAILGLGLSGHPYAHDRLIELRERDLGPADVIFEALEANELVAAKGLVRYIADGMAADGKSP